MNDISKNRTINGFIVERNKDRSVNSNYGSLDYLPKEDEAEVEVLFSSINYKDRLVCDGSPGVTRLKKIIPGIDFIGTWHGKNFLIVGEDIGINRNGSWADRCFVKKKWLKEIPASFLADEIAKYGTAGFTAALITLNITSKYNVDDGPVLIRGANTAVGNFSRLFLSALGYEVELISNSKIIDDRIPEEKRYTPESFKDKFDKPIGKEVWSCVVDLIGGDDLSVAFKNLKTNGVCLVVGNIAGNNCLNLPLIPMMVSGCSLIGISLETYPREDWWRLSEIIEKLDKEISSKIIIDFVKFKNLKKHLNQKNCNSHFTRNIIDFS